MTPTKSPSMPTGNRTHPATILFFVTSLLLCTLADTARVLSQPDHVYLTRAVPGRLHCPVDANPPVTRVTWTKDGRPVEGLYVASDDMAADGRVTVTGDGTMVFTPVKTEDSGRYSCTPHSSLGVGQPSQPVQVLVKGNQSKITTSSPQW